MDVKREFISVTLEIVAFFCVTIDLYGRQRLEASTAALTSALERIVGRPKGILSQFSYYLERLPARLAANWPRHLPRQLNPFSGRDITGLEIESPEFGARIIVTSLFVYLLTWLSVAALV